MRTRSKLAIVVTAFVTYAIAAACGGEASAPQAPPVAAPAVWSFAGNCDAGLSLACPATVCPPLDGGTAAQSCDPPFASCVNAPPYASKTFACEPTGHSVWTLSAYCGPPPFTSCTAPAVAPCASATGALAGQPCSTPLATCVLDATSLYTCAPGGGTFWVFNGYCSADDAGPLFQSCSTDAAPCAPLADAAGIVGFPCALPLDRCLNPDGRIFVCTPR